MIQESHCDFQELRTEIFKIVNNADLSTMTAKQVRQELESHFNRDLVNEKSIIAEFIKEALQTRMENEQPIQDIKNDSEIQSQTCDSEHVSVIESDRQLAIQLQEQDKRPKRSTSSKAFDSKESKKPKASKDKDPCRGFPECRLTPSMSEFMNGMEKATSSLVTKAIWEHIKSNNLQDPSRKQWIDCDSTLQALFKKKRIHMFKIPAAVQKHLLRDYE